MSRQLLRHLGRDLEKRMAGHVEVVNPVDLGRSALAAQMTGRPHSCFRNALDCLFSAPWITEEMSYVEGWLIYNVAGEEPLAHGWIHHLRGIVDPMLPRLTDQARQDYPKVLVRLEYRPVKFWRPADFTELLDYSVSSGLDSLALPLTRELQESIVKAQKVNPAHFERITLRQSLFDLK